MEKIKLEIKTLVEKSNVGDSVWWVLHLIKVNLLRCVSAKKHFYYSYYNTHKCYPDFENPKSFDEKQLWLKLNYRNPLCTKCSDKFLVRKYVKESGFEQILNPLIAAYDSVKEIEWSKLPNQFYIKTNHTSGCNVRCNDINNFDIKAASKRLNRGMKHDQSLDSKEWNYKFIKRKILVEEVIESKNGDALADYRFLCSYGKCSYLFIDIDTASDDGSHRHDAKRNVYDNQMNLLDVKANRDNFNNDIIKKPKNYDEMVFIAEKLSLPFPFCRVDLYNVDEKIIFGEITFFHAGGLCNIYPNEWEYRFGDTIDIEKAKIDIKNDYIKS